MSGTVAIECARVACVVGKSLVGRKEPHTTWKGYLRYYVLVCASNAVGVLVEDAGLYTSTLRLHVIRGALATLLFEFPRSDCIFPSIQLRG